MSLLKGIRATIALSRLQEEQLYEFILDELETGRMRRGLMAKAIANSGGDEKKAQANYIKLRLQSLIDENTVMEAISSIASQETAPGKRTDRLKGHEARVRRQEKFSLKETKKGEKGNFWASLRSKFDESRRDDWWHLSGSPLLRQHTF